MSRLGSYDTTLLFLDHRRGRVGTAMPREVRSCEWTRTKNEFTQAKMTLAATDALCNDLEPWLHQVAVFRDESPVWRGFVMTTAASARSLTVTARDPAIWFSKRRVVETTKYVDTDPTAIAVDVISKALAAFDPFGLAQTMETELTGLYVDFEVTRDEMYVADVLKELVDVGLQWTMVGATLVIGPATRATVLPTMTDDHFDSQPTVEKDGTDAVNDLLVLGKGASGSYADSSGGPSAPLLQATSKADVLTTELQCVNEARKQVRNRAVARRRLNMGGSSRLMPNAPVSLGDLVPGTTVPVATETTGILVRTRMELTEVAVKATASGDEVSVTLGEMPIRSLLQEQASPTDNWEDGVADGRD